MTIVTCCQLAPHVGDLGTNVRATVDAVVAAVDAGAAIVVLPELATSGYVFESTGEAEAVAISPTDPVFAAWAGALGRGGGQLVVGGFAERGDDGHLYNSAAAVTRAGVVAVYRKTHLWDREKLWFRPGDDAPPVVATAAGRVGVAICYDVEFPEVTRHLALSGAELVAVPTNWPLVPRPAGERPPEVLIAMAAARVNRMVIACCDRTGTERGVEWTAGTAIVGADGWVLATAGDAASASADVELSRSADKRITGRADLLGDRRPDAYARWADDREHSPIWARIFPPLDPGAERPGCGGVSRPDLAPG
jgi:predicted amidohydrolase